MKHLIIVFLILTFSFQSIAQPPQSIGDNFINLSSTLPATSLCSNAHLDLPTHFRIKRNSLGNFYTTYNPLEFNDIKITRVGFESIIIRKVVVIPARHILTIEVKECT